MGSAQIWSTIHQQLRVPDLPPDVSFTDRASCPQQVPLVMMRPIASTAKSIDPSNYLGYPQSVHSNNLSIVNQKSDQQL